ncbi:VOC family protein [Oceanobacillus halophilus]|uniref:VOC family protein n=1 Tax=Oceanobacillus halophilus TaxID=930130 RepID=A0A494ZXR3_9BACI|nr:VOC family protein [Oceanobacillus halophilus]RKQ30908.1 VOC family protein [Oceanobacillus halophilus]
MLALDHIVIASRNPKADAEEFARRFDVEVIEGGKHEIWGTYNFLAYFQNDCYLEWLGVMDIATAKRSDNPLIHQLVAALENGIEGTIQYALRTNQMDYYVRYFYKTDISFIGPIPGSRKKPDDTMLEWKMLFPMESSNLPFLIEWNNGKNIPADSSLINNRRIKVMKTPADENQFSNIYQTKFINNNSSLENSLIRIGDRMSFELN